LIDLSLQLFLILQLVIVSYYDFKTKKISNIWVILNLIVHVFQLLLVSDLYPLILSNYYLSLSVLLFCFILFLLKIMGAGDAKYIFSILVLIPRFNQELFLEILIYISLIIGLINLTFNLYLKYKSKNLSNKSIPSIKSIPYSPVILLSWIIFIFIKIMRY
jgi:prepilin peptidase CpaA